MKQTEQQLHFMHSTHEYKHQVRTNEGDAYKGSRQELQALGLVHRKPDMMYAIPGLSDLLNQCRQRWSPRIGGQGKTCSYPLSLHHALDLHFESRWS